MKKILIVEQDADMIRYLNLVAARFGFNAVVAETPEAAAESLERDAFALAIVSKSPFGRDFGKRLARIVEKVGGGRVVVVCGEDFEEVARISAAAPPPPPAPGQEDRGPISFSSVVDI